MLAYFENANGGLRVHGRGQGSTFVFVRLTANFSLSYSTHSLIVCSLSFEVVSGGNGDIMEV